MSIAITGASGKLGRRTAELVLEEADPTDVVLITRSPEKLADLAELGTEIRVADFEAPETLEAAFAGVEKLLIISTTIAEERGPIQNRAVDAAVAAGVKHLVYTSFANPINNPSVVSADHLATEEAVKASGLEWTILRNNVYADDQLPGIGQAAASGQFMTNGGDGSAAYVSREDCAAAAAAALVGEGRSGTYEITGPESLSAVDLAALAGNEVAVIQVNDEEYAQGLVAAAGLPEPLAVLIASIGRATREGYFAEVSGSFEELTGRSATPLAQLLNPVVNNAALPLGGAALSP